MGQVLDILRFVVERITPFEFMALAAFFNAVMDRLETSISFQQSVFKNRSVAFWCKPISAHNVKFIRYTKYRPDAWHLAKSCMLCSLIATAVTYEAVTWWWLDFMVLGLVWLGTFNLFYNRLLVSKKVKNPWKTDFV